MIFSPSSGNWKGVFNHFKDNKIISSSTNANGNCDSSVLMQRTAASSLECYIANSQPIHIIFDLLFFRMKITHYNIETSKDCSPPVIWEVSGSNKENGEWAIIDAPPQNDSLCPRKGTETTCSERTTSLIKCEKRNNNYYRYIRFSVIEDRYNKDDYTYIRLGGLEFFGVVYSNENYQKKCSVHISRTKDFYTMSIILATIYS